MPTFPNSPRLLKAGLVLLTANSDTLGCVLTLQHNIDHFVPTWRSRGEEAGERGGLRLYGQELVLTQAIHECL